VTPTGRPLAPVNVTAVGGNAQATVTWTAPDDGGSPINGYRVTSSPGGFTAVTSGATTATVTGLANGTAYTFTVMAKNALGAGPASAPSNAVTPNSFTVPGVATAVTATAGDGQASVTWTAPASDGGSAITSYTVTSSPGGLTGTATTGTTAVVAGLSNGASYTFTVVANNVAGAGPSSAPSNSVTPAAQDGAGTASVTPASVAVSESTTLTFSYTAAGTMTDGSLTVDVPSGWTAPSSTLGAPGYTTASTGAISVQGRRIAVAGINLAAGATMTINYGTGGISSQVLPAMPPGSTAFAVSHRATSSGVLTAIAGPPSVLVTDGSQVSCTDASITWTGAGDGTNWIDPANWSRARVPDSSDGVCIAAGPATVSMTGIVSVQWLTSARALDIHAPVHLLDANRPSQLEGATSNWRFGDTSGRLTLGPTASLEVLQAELDPAAELVVDGTLLFPEPYAPRLSVLCDAAGNPGSLVNNGRIQFSGRGTIDAGGCPAAVLTNSATGIITAGDSGTGGISAFGRLAIGVDNQGLIEAAATGAINYTSGHPVNGTWRTTNGSIDLDPGPYPGGPDRLAFADPVLQGQFMFHQGAPGLRAIGTLHIPAGTEVYTQSASYEVRTNIAAGGILNIYGARLASLVDGPGTLQLTSGTYDADITPGGPRNWNGGTFVNRHSVQAGADLSIVYNGSTLGMTGELTIDGTLSFAVGTPWTLHMDCDPSGAAGSLVNNSRIEFAGQGTIDAGTCASALLTNAATGVITTVGSGSGTLSVAVNNLGFIDPAITVDPRYNGG
jgi:hypothetical protein